MCRGRAELAQNDNELATLQRAFELKMQEKAEMVRRSEAEAVRHRNISGALFKTEANKAEIDNEFGSRKREEEDLRLLNGKLCSGNYDLRAELEALRHHCNVLAGQNVSLNGELERFVETDESIRKSLNRKPRVEHIKDHQVSDMRQSLRLVEKSRSPRRKPSKRRDNDSGRTSGQRTLGNSPLRHRPADDKKKPWIPCAYVEHEHIGH